MKLFARCPQCGKAHFVQPARCGCGHDFSKYGEQTPTWFECPKCGGHVTSTARQCPACHWVSSRVVAFACPKCRKPVDGNARYCACGQELTFEAVRCPYCKKAVRASSACCPECGKNLYYSDAPPPMGAWKCGRCGYDLPTASSVCPICSDAL